jgi:DNA-binding NarL/FixJ family response regulator
MAMKIVLVDDQPVPGLTLRRWLKKERELEVVGEAVPGSPALALIQITEPDIVLLDLLTSPEAGLNMARLIREQYPDLPIVAIGEATDGKVRAEAAQAGAWAYFPKKRAEDLTPAIRSVINGKGKRFQDLTDRVFERPPADSFVAGPGQSPLPRATEPPPRAPQPPPRAPEPPPRAPEPPPRAPEPPPRAPEPPPRAPEPVLTPQVVAVPRKPPKAPAVPIDTVVKPKARQSVTPKPAPEAKRAAPVRRGHEQVAWVSRSIEPVSSFELPQPKKRRSRKNKDVQEETEVRGPTGLPRRSGGRR